MNETILWSPGVTLEEIEKQVILKAFSHYRGNKTTTANALGIAIRTLDNKLEKYEFDKLEQEKKDVEQRNKREDFLRRARGNPPNNLGIPFTPSSGYSPDSGFRMESITNSSQEQSLSMPERREVQTVLHKQVTKSDSKKAR